MLLCENCLGGRCTCEKPMTPSKGPSLPRSARRSTASDACHPPACRRCCCASRPAGAGCHPDAPSPASSHPRIPPSECCPSRSAGAGDCSDMPTPAFPSPPFPRSDAFPPAPLDAGRHLDASSPASCPSPSPCAKCRRSQLVEPRNPALGSSPSPRATSTPPPCSAGSTSQARFGHAAGGPAAPPASAGLRTKLLAPVHAAAP